MAYIYATYRVDRAGLTPKEFEKLAVDMAVNAGIDTWTPVDLSRYQVSAAALRRDFGARLAAVDSDIGLVKIAFPSQNIDPKFGSIPFLLNTVAGDILGLSGNRVRLVDLDLPQDFLAAFDGPNLGSHGLRELLGVKDRPLLAFSVKPRVGLPLGAFAGICKEAFEGGADIVEDDTRLLQTPNSAIIDRVKAVAEVVGKLTTSNRQRLYSVNVTGRADMVVEMAGQAVEAGAGALKLDVLATGYSALQALTQYVKREQQGKVPIFVYPAMYSVFEPVIERRVLLRLSRLCGADIIYAGSPQVAGRIDVTESDVQLVQYHQLLLESHGAIRPTMPSVAAGLHPGSVEFVRTIVGHSDFAYFIGGGIAGYPLGIRKGTELFMKAITSFHIEGKTGMQPFTKEELESMERAGWKPVTIPSELKDRSRHLGMLHGQ